MKNCLLGLPIVLGFFCLAWGYWIPAKAIVAQVLLERAWEITLQTGELVKPWPWADCWPIGRLSQDRLGIELIVLEGASGEPLAFGPGRLEASDILGGEYHAVLAGHRDTSFSFLKDLHSGDELGVETLNGNQVFMVSETRVVEASNLYLNAQNRKTLSLVTCYPFDSVLPQTKQRYLVTARAES